MPMVIKKAMNNNAMYVLQDLHTFFFLHTFTCLFIELLKELL